MYNIDRNKKIKDVEPIEQSGNYDISGDNIFNVVEEPLLNPIRSLYDKNIITIMCSANRKDISQGIAYIDIEESYLSKENLNYLDIMCKTFPKRYKHVYYDSYDNSCEENHIGPRYIKLIMAPITEDTTVGEINDYFLDIVNSLKTQDIIKGVFSSFDDAKKDFSRLFYPEWYDSDADFDAAVRKSYIEYDGKYYDSEETLRRHLVYLKSLEDKEKSKSRRREEQED